MLLQGLQHDTAMQLRSALFSLKIKFVMSAFTFSPGEGISKTLTDKGGKLPFKIGMLDVSKVEAPFILTVAI